MLSKIIRKPADRPLSPQPSATTPWWQMQNGVFGYEFVVHRGYNGISPLTLSRVKTATAATSPQSWLSISEIDTGSSSRSLTLSLSEIDSNSGSQRSFGRGDAEDTPYAVDAATAVHKQTVRSWRSLSTIDSNTGSQRSGATFGREDVNDTPSSQQIRDLNRDVEFIFGHKEAVEELTSGR